MTVGHAGGSEVIGYLSLTLQGAVSSGDSDLRIII